MKRLNELYYMFKPLVPRRLQLYLRRAVGQHQRDRYNAVWPIDESAGKAPKEWAGWPDGKKFALVLTHDVDCEKGHGRCLELMELEKNLGFRSSFNFVPLRYSVSSDLRKTLQKNGFEIGVHGLYHDGKYYISRKIFRERAKKINFYLKDWNAVGYRAPAMFSKLDWFHDLSIEYDASTFDTDPFEMNGEGVGTIFPFIVAGGCPSSGFVELPYTLPQDFTLFSLLKERNIDIWKQKLEWIVKQGGMALMLIHPDYMHFGGCKQGDEEYPASYYAEFLEYIKTTYAGQYWHALPKDVARYFRSTYNSQKAR